MIKIIRFQPNDKQFFILLYIAILSTSALLGLSIILDTRLNVLGEPFGDFLNAISIAISYKTYGITGFAGLEDVLTILKGIPVSSSYGFDTMLSYKSYQKIINEFLLKATSLQNPNTEDLHGSINDIFYIVYVIVAFSIFGIKIQSLSYLWILIFFISIVTILVPYRKDIVKLLLLWCLIASIFLVVIANPGVGIQLLTVYNQRFLPILGLIPLLHIVFSITTQNKNTGIGLLTSLMQMLLLLFIIFCRGSAQWMFIAIFLVAIYSISSKVKTIIGYNDKQILFLKIISGVKIPVLILAIFLSVKAIIPQSLNEVYKNPIWAHSHVFWYGIVISLTTDPILKNKYVCSEKPLKDRLKNLTHILCDNSNFNFYNRFMLAVRNPPSDMHAYHSAIRYLRDQGSDEQIGFEIEKNGLFNIRWGRLDEIMKILFFKMIGQDPIDCLYMFIIIKPVRYFYEVSRYIGFFINSLINSPNIFGTLSFLSFILGQNLFLMRWYHKAQYKIKQESNVNSISLGWILPIIYLCSIVPSIVFYCSPHTIVDSVTVLLSLGFSLQIFSFIRIR